MKTLTLLGTTLGLSFTAGLNLYATVLMTGLAVRLGWVQLPPGLEGLTALAHPTVLAVAGVLYVVEFLADKIPAVDHAWDALHTFVRPLGGVLIAWAAVSGTNMSPALEVPLLLLAGGVTLSAHAGKAGTRLASAGAGGHAAGAGVGLSLVEDVAAFTLAPLALAYPVATLAVVVVSLALFGLVAPLGWRFSKSRLAAVGYLLRHKVLDRELASLDASHLPEPVTVAFADEGIRPEGSSLVLPAYATALPGIPRWAPGFVALVPGGAVFACRGWFKTRVARVSWVDGKPVLARRVTGFVLHARSRKGRATVTFFPLSAPMGEALERAMALEGNGSARREPGLERASGESPA